MTSLSAEMPQEEVEQKIVEVLLGQFLLQGLLDQLDVGLHLYVGHFLDLETLLKDLQVLSGHVTGEREHPGLADQELEAFLDEVAVVKELVRLLHQVKRQLEVIGLDGDI